jgi:acetoin utilization protein AcuB
MLNLTVDGFMTRCVHTIGHDQSLAAAHRLMRAHEIRHLPVLDAGKLVGILSQRDLQLIETLADVDPEAVEVAEAMSTETYTVSSRAAVRKVAAEMADRKFGSVVVVEQERVIGIFTTVDALRALSALLEVAQDTPQPTAARTTAKARKRSIRTH